LVLKMSTGNYSLNTITDDDIERDPLGVLDACLSAKIPALNTITFGQHPDLFTKPDVHVVELSGREFGDNLSPVGLARAADVMLKSLQQAPIGTIHNADTGWDLLINKKGRAKMGDNGDLTPADSKAVAGLLDLVNRAVLAETHSDDEHQNGDVQAIHRLYAPVLIDGVLYRVKLTVKDYKFLDGCGERKNLHAIETMELEKENALLGTVPSNSRNQRAQPTTGRTISIANLMQGAIRQDGSAFVTKDDAAIDSIGDDLAAITDDDIDRDPLGVLQACISALEGMNTLDPSNHQATLRHLERVIGQLSSASPAQQALSFDFFVEMKSLMDAAGYSADDLYTLQNHFIANGSARRIDAMQSNALTFAEYDHGGQHIYAVSQALHDDVTHYQDQLKASVDNINAEVNAGWLEHVATATRLRPLARVAAELASSGRPSPCPAALRLPAAESHPSAY
jgi:hypothetical protein